MVHMIEDMVLAVAVIPGTLGAVAELQARVLRIRPAADLAFVVVALLPFLLFYRLAELHRLAAVTGLKLICLPIEIRREEDEQIQHGDNRHQRQSPQPRRNAQDHGGGVENRLNHGQPFHLDRKNKEKTNHGFRIGQGVGEKQRRVDIPRSCQRNGEAIHKQDQNGRQNGQQLLSVLAAILVLFVDGLAVPLAGAGYVNSALFFAYALTYPETVVRLFFILPIKMKWLAMIEAVFYAAAVVLGITAGLWGLALMPVVAMLNLFIFFSPDFYRKTDQFQARHRREAVQFRKAVKEQKRQKGYNHKCEVCGRTDTENPGLQFRYCSKCTGYHCYCEDHIFNHVHHTE